MADRSLFLPATLTDPSRPYPRITATRDGSYWNLVMPYAFASGFFTPGGGEAKGILRYLSLHGSRLAGVTRADAHIAYGRNIVGDGLGEVYVMNQSRFLADNDQPDQLTLTLYGMLAAGMTRDTFVSGEAVSLLPVGTAYYRTMYMPPNLGANSSFLETLKLLLVHERRGPRGAPRGLDLAFSTPRAWLADGATIDVKRVRTSFGPLSFSLERTGKTIRIDVANPKAPEPARLRLRLPSGQRMLSIRLGTRRLHRRPAHVDGHLARPRRPAAPRRDAQMTFCSRRTAPVAKRSTANCERSNVGSTPSASCARCSPTTGPCWKPWPENPVA